jgi:hypothetical protein
MRTFEYRLFVNTEQSRKLMACLVESRIIYNGMLETIMAQYELDGTFPSKYELETVFKGQGEHVEHVEHVPATTVQMRGSIASRSPSNGFLWPGRTTSLVSASLASKSRTGGTPFN